MPASFFGTICVVSLHSPFKPYEMKFIFKTFAICIAVLGIAAAPLPAQSKAETKLYNSALAKGDLKTANKFLAKFPNSVYAPKVTRLRDSITFAKIDNNDVNGYIAFLEQNPKSYFAQAANKRIEELNTSSITDTQAMEIALGAGFAKEEIATVKGVKNLNREHVAVIVAPQAGTSEYRIVLLAQENGNWKETSSLKEQVYTNDYALKEFKAGDDIKAVTINGVQHLYFTYVNSSSDIEPRSRMANNDCEMAFNLYSLADNSVYNVLFSGKMENGIIYGSSMDSAQGGMMATPQQTYLIRAMAAKENLKPFEEERFMAQELIKWWYSNNPQNAKNIAFGIIPDNSPLLALFNQDKNKEKVGNYTVALLEKIFGNTMIIVRNNENGQHSLAMCQPTPLNDKDLELSTFYGEKGNILVLYYFKGKNTVKKRLNLSSKRLY